MRDLGIGKIGTNSRPAVRRGIAGLLLTHDWEGVEVEPAIPSSNSRARAAQDPGEGSDPRGPTSERRWYLPLLFLCYYSTRGKPG